MRIRTLAATAVALAVLPASATAATKPVVTTGGVANVTASSALLKGSVNPEGSTTAYYFQLGTTQAYGYSTPAVSAGSGRSTVNVAESAAGLQSFTTYHYRIVGVSPAGTSVGVDRSFTTLKIPLSLQIAAAPNPVLFGGTAVVEGTLAGTGNGNREVTLEANPFPYSGGFHAIGNPELTTASGSFSFPVLGLGITTQFLVTTVGKPSVTSPIATEGVLVSVSAHVRRARGSHRVRVFGSVAPGLNGAAVAIEKIGRKHRYVVVGGTTLHATTPASASFSKVVRVRTTGVYRVFVQTPGGAYISNYSAPIVIR